MWLDSMTQVDFYEFSLCYRHRGISRVWVVPVDVYLISSLLCEGSGSLVFT